MYMHSILMSHADQQCNISQGIHTVPGLILEMMSLAYNFVFLTRNNTTLQKKSWLNLHFTDCVTVNNQSYNFIQFQTTCQSNSLQTYIQNSMCMYIYTYKCMYLSTFLYFMKSSALVTFSMWCILILPLDSFPYICQCTHTHTHVVKH